MRISSCILLLVPVLLHAQHNARLNGLFAQAENVNKANEIKLPVYKGAHPEVFPYQTKENMINKAEELKPILSSLEKLSEDLSEQDEINRSIRILQLRNEISEATYQTYLLPMNAEGGFYNSPAFFLPNLPFGTKDDYEAYLQWLPTFEDYLLYHQGLLKEGIKKKIQLPKVLVRNNISLLTPWTSEVTSHPFYEPFQKMPEAISTADQKALKGKARKILSSQIIPTYRKLQAFLEAEYLPGAPEKVGISEIKGGKSYYEDRVRHFTTLNLSPDSVFNMGQAEVKRIKSLMDQIILALKFDGDFQAFINFLRTDPQFYPTSARDLLNRAAWISKQAEGKLPELFANLYSLPFTVAPVPDHIAPNYTSGRFVSGNRAQNRPGTYWVNTYKLDSRTLYTLPALSLHEAVPGHHLQITLASELKDLPEFRNDYYISAFGEGWGLYAEYLGEEMGMYTTPYEWFGRYTYEMWRACRLVVDVGMHYKGWTRQEAIDFMASNTALSLHEVNTEIDRYIGWPGQALSYKIGEIQIKSLRKKAEKALGEDFDIQTFHHEILREGSVPLSVLESRITRYIEKMKAEG